MPIPRFGFAFLPMFLFGAAMCGGAYPQQGIIDKSTFYVYYADQPVGQESFELAETGEGYSLKASASLTKPILFETELLLLETNLSGQPTRFRFKGKVRGVEQEVSTRFSENAAENTISAAGRSSVKTDDIHAGAFVLPNLLFSPYLLLARVIGAEKGVSRKDLYAYVPPQAEVPFSLEKDVEKKRWGLWLQNPTGNKVHVIVEFGELDKPIAIHIPSASLSAYREGHQPRQEPSRSENQFRSEEVSFFSDGVELKGTLTFPTKGSGPWPAVLLLAGSGAQDRDETVFGIRILAQIAEYLSRDGYAVLRYDKRGAGESGGNLLAATLETLTNDAVAAANFLAGHPEVEPEQIFLAGHSEGGIVAAKAASRLKHVAGLILLTAPALRGEEVMREQLVNLLSASETTAEQREDQLRRQERIIQAARSGHLDETLTSEIPAPLQKFIKTPWFQDWLGYNPLEAYRKVKIPVLVIGGGKDTQVPPHHANQIYAAMLEAGNKDVSVHVVADINHLLVRADTGHYREYEDLPEKHVNRDLLALIKKWLKEHG